MYLNKLQRGKTNYTINHKENFDEITFTSPYPSGNNIVDKVKCLFFNGNTNKSIVLVHGMGNRNFKYLKYYGEKFSQYGYSVIMPVLPYHYERKIDNVEFLSGYSEDIEKRFYQAINDIFACIDFLEIKKYESINIIGVSLGGMIALITKSLDNRVNKASLVVTGGNFEQITWHSIATKVLRIRYESPDSPCNVNKCKEIHRSFDHEALNFKYPENLNKIPSCFRYDASIFANSVDKNEVIMFNALFDIFIPQKSSVDLWRRLDYPKRYLLPSGHLSSHIVFKKFIFTKSLDFFNV